jgi:hypothetical protein
VAVQSLFIDALMRSPATARYRFRTAGASSGDGGGAGVVDRTCCTDAASMNTSSTATLRCLLVLLSLAMPIAAFLITVGPGNGADRHDPAAAPPAVRFDGAADNEIHWWPAALSMPEFFDEPFNYRFKNSFE